MPLYEIPTHLEATSVRSKDGVPLCFSLQPQPAESAVKDRARVYGDIKPC